jgi:hypothetical protein
MDKTLGQLGSVYAAQAPFYKETFSFVLKKQLYDFESLFDLAKQLQAAEKTFTTTKDKLNSLKAKLLQEKKIDKWKLDSQTAASFPLDVLMNNKHFLQAKMLPKVHKSRETWTNRRAMKCGICTSPLATIQIDC